MTELRGWLKYLVETVKLAAAILLYSWWSPGWQPLVKDLPIVGASIAGILSATVVILLTHIIWPLARVRVVVQRPQNDAPYRGPSIDLECASHTRYAAGYKLRIHSQSFGVVGGLLLKAAAKHGLELAFRVKKDLLVVHVESGNADEERIDDGVVVTLDESVSTRAWEYVVVSVDSKEVPSHLEIDVKTELIFPNGKPWWAFGLWASSNVKQIVLALKEK